MLATALAALVGFALAVYAITGGLDLGVGLLSLIAPRARDREAMMSSLAPVWYGNAIWLVLAGFVLAAAFPVGGSVLRALWPWLALLLLALAVRGAAYALRGRAGALGGALGRACDAVFGLASGLAILCQGLVLGAVLSGVPATGRLLGWDLVLGLLCAAGLVGAYALLGAGWLIHRTSGATRTFGREVGHAAVVLTLGALALALAWAALIGAPVAARWSGWPDAMIPSITLAAVLGLGVWTWRGLWRGPAGATFLRAVAVVLAVFTGLAISLSPGLPGAAGGPLERVADEALALQYTLFDAALAAPVLLTFILQAVHLLRSKAAPEPPGLPTKHTHVGRRASSLYGNALHLS